MSKLTAAYVAGLIDGEGSVEIQKRKRAQCVNNVYFCPRIRICMTDKNIIEWLKDSFGGFISYRKEHDNCRESFSWAMTSVKSVKPFIEKVYPYLKVKKQQALLIKDFIKTYNSNSYYIVKNKLGYGIGKHKELKEDIFNKRIELYQKIKELNKRGLAR